MTYPLPAFTLLPKQARLINAEDGLVLEVVSGCLWLTRPNDIHDHFLVAGMSMQLNHRSVLIQSDKPPNPRGWVATQYRLVPCKVSRSGAHLLHTLCLRAWRDTCKATFKSICKAFQRSFTRRLCGS